LVGRDHELARLRGALDEASRGHGHVVAIVGEAGIGKSSVLMALAAEAEARGARLLLGRAYETEQVLTFGPWIDALRSGHVVADASVLRRVLDELSRESHFVQLVLAPLTRTDTMALVRLLTKATFWAVAAGRMDEQIWHASEGNPFMVVETVRALHEGTAPPS